VQCDILAGGLGTRNRSVSEHIPKTLLPVAGRPFADWQLDWLSDAGVDSVVYCIGHLGHQVVEHVGSGERWGLDVAFVDEGSELRGTAGAILLAQAQGVLDDRFLVLYGDSWLQADPADVFRAAEASGQPALMTVFENHDRWDRSNVAFHDGLVRQYEKSLVERPADMVWIDYGLSVLTSAVLTDHLAPGERGDLAPILTRLAAQGRLAGYAVADRFFEIGSPEGLAELDGLLGERTRASD
jgi:NDP-sugar pyrophosphorylase family protein